MANENKADENKFHISLHWPADGGEPHPHPHSAYTRGGSANLRRKSARQLFYGELSQLSRC